jgi:four helix bundle protein
LGVGRWALGARVHAGWPKWFVGAFRDLDVYRRSIRLADGLHGSVVQWPSLDLWTVGVQMVRAADSVGANIAEAEGRSTDADQRRFLIVARASALELQHWLDRAVMRRLGLPDGAQLEARRLGRMLNGLIKTRHQR